MIRILDLYEPHPMPNFSNTDHVNEIVTGTLPILMNLFIALTSMFILINVRKIKSFENQNNDMENDRR